MEILIIHYNTPELTTAAVCSVYKHTEGAHITIFENSDAYPLPANFESCFPEVTIIDNSHGQIVDWNAWLSGFPDKEPCRENDWGSAKHCYSVDLCLDLFPKGFVLMDSDVLLRRDISDIADSEQAWVGRIHTNTRSYGVTVYRIMPMLCWINTSMLSQYGIRYFNPDKMWKLSRCLPDNRYDTGAWLLESCNTYRLPFRTVNLDDYIVHYGHASWRQKPGVHAWLHEHRKLWLSLD